MNRKASKGRGRGAAGGDRVAYDFGALPVTAPSVKRVDVLGWMCAGATLGALSGWCALSLLWRPLPGLDAPPGPLSFHAGKVARLLVHALSERSFRADALAYRELLAGLPWRAKAALAWRAAVSACAACAPAALLARGLLRPRDGLTALRGSARHEGPEAVARLNASLAGRVKARPDHLIAPGVRYSSDMFSRHLLLVAGVGSGKSTALKPLIQAVIDAGESLLLFDPKGEFTMGFGKPAIIAPWDRRSLAWDVAADMRNIGDMRRFAAAMVKEAHDPMWSNAARQILVGFMIHLKATRGRRWGWRELADMMSTPQQELLPIMRDRHPEAVRAVERASVTTQGILINLSSFAAPIFDLAEAWGDVGEGRRVSFVEWTRERGRHRQIILQGHGAYPELTKGYLEGIIGTVSAIVNSVEMDDDENRKLWLIADECPQMGRVPLRPLLELGRSRGFRCALACQDLAQFEEVHGAPMVKALVSMVGTILVGQLMQGDTADQMCKALGTREVERESVSSSYNGGGGSGRSTTLSFSRDELAVYKPSELASRLGPAEDGKGVVLALFTGGQAYELFWPHYTMRRARLAHMPAPWTLGLRARGDAKESLPDGFPALAGGVAGVAIDEELAVVDVCIDGFRSIGDSLGIDGVHGADIAGGLGGMGSIAGVEGLKAIDDIGGIRGASPSDRVDGFEAVVGGDRQTGMIDVGFDDIKAGDILSAEDANDLADLWSADDFAVGGAAASADVRPHAMQWPPLGDAARHFDIEPSDDMPSIKEVESWRRTAMEVTSVPDGPSAAGYVLHGGLSFASEHVAEQIGERLVGPMDEAVADAKHESLHRDGDALAGITRAGAAMGSPSSSIHADVARAADALGALSVLVLTFAEAMRTKVGPREIVAPARTSVIDRVAAR